MTMTFGCGGCSLQRMQLKVNDSCVRRFSSCRPGRPLATRTAPPFYLRSCLCAEIEAKKADEIFFFGRRDLVVGDLARKWEIFKGALARDFETAGLREF